MLRWFVGLLVVANLVFWAWSGGGLDAVTGMPVDADREPERLAQQVQPEAIRLLPDPGAAADSPAVAPGAGNGAARPGASAVSSAATAATAASARVAAAAASAAAAVRPASAVLAAGPAVVAATAASQAPRSAVPTGAMASAAAAGAWPASAASVACLEAGPFTLAELGVARAAVAAAVGPGRWSERRQETPGLWMIVMGPYADAEALQRKKDEVGSIRVPFEEITGLPGLDNGLSLGRFDNRAAADAALARSVTQGIRTARVVMLRPPVTMHHLRIAGPDEALSERLATIRFAAPGRTFRGC